MTDPWVLPPTTGGTLDFNRDHHGRPLITVPGGTRPVPYARPSTVAGLATNQYALSDYRVAQVAIGLSRSPDIAAILSTMEHTPDTRRRLVELATEAADRHGGTVAANWGTAIHAATELGAVREWLPDRVRADALAYDAEIERTGLVPIESEVHVVNDDLQVAGTLDTLYRVPDGTAPVSLADGTRVEVAGRVVVGDSKSSARGLRKVSTAAQVGVYSHSWRYDVGTGVRSVLHPDIEPRVGIAMWIPTGQGRCEASWLDLSVGYRMFAAARYLHRNASGRGLVTRVPDRY